MDLSIQKLSKAFLHRALFTDISYHIPSGARGIISGSNGSGKSTLLKIISGGMLPSEGHIRYTLNEVDITVEEVFRYVHFSAPYVTILEELSLREMWHMHRSLGLMRAHEHFDEWVDQLQFSFDTEQPVRLFSSGMKQRIRLALTLTDPRPLMLLDEPGTNLDEQGKAWMRKMVQSLPVASTVIIATNESDEMDLGERFIQL